MVVTVVLRGGGDDGTTVGKSNLARQSIDEKTHQRQLMSMNLFEGSVSVIADLVDVGKTVEGEEHRGSARQSEFCPEGQEGWPCVFSFLCAEGQVGQGGALLQV